MKDKGNISELPKEIREMFEKTVAVVEEIRQENKNNMVERFKTYFEDMNYDKIIVEMDVKKGIVVMNENGGVIRELEFKEPLEKEDAVDEIIKKLKEMC
jgi:hypothetical protein